MSLVNQIMLEISMLQLLLFFCFIIIIIFIKSLVKTKRLK